MYYHCIWNVCYWYETQSKTAKNALITNWLGWLGIIPRTYVWYTIIICRQYTVKRTTFCKLFLRLHAYITGQSFPSCTINSNKISRLKIDCSIINHDYVDWRTVIKSYGNIHIHIYNCKWRYVLALLLIHDQCMCNWNMQYIIQLYHQL